MDLDERRRHRLDERRKHRLDECAPEFNRRVETMDVVDELGPLLPDSARQRIQCVYRQDGTIAANRELSKRVRSRERWFEKLISALQKCGGVDDLIEKLITDKKGSLMPEYVKMKSGSPEIAVQSSDGATRCIAQTFPNKGQALEEQATQLTKYRNARSDSSIKELASARDYQQTGTLQNAMSHPEKIMSQDRCEDVTQPSSYKSRIKETSFPNKEQALEEQISQCRKIAATSQTRPGTSKELASTRNYQENQEKGILENTASQKDRKEVKSQRDHNMQSYRRKEGPCKEKGNSETSDSESQIVCKESITSSIDEKEKDESAGNIGLEPTATADEPQKIDQTKDLGVINGTKKPNLNDNVINAGQQSHSTSPMHDIPAYAKFAERDMDPKGALEDMSKGCDLFRGACQNDQRSYETGEQRGIHERSTICVSNEYDGIKKVIEMGREAKNLCQVDPVLNKTERITSDVSETYDDTKLRFFNEDIVKEQKYFSKAGEHEKAILKDLDLLTPTGERNLTKIKEFGNINEAGSSRDSYQPLRSDDSQEYSLLVSETSEGEALYTYAANSRETVLKNEHAFTASSGVVSKVVASGEEETSQNNAIFTVQNKTLFRKETEAVKASHSIARNNVCVENTLAGHEQLMPIKDVNDRVANDVSVIAEIPAVREEGAEDDLGSQNLIGNKLTKALGCKGGENETDAIKEEAEAPPVLKELCNLGEISIENLRYNEVKEMGSVGIDEIIGVKHKNVESVNDKEDVSNDVRPYKHENEYDRKAEVISWNPAEPEDSVSQPGMGVLYGNDNDENSSNTNLESSLEDDYGEGSTTQLSNDNGERSTAQPSNGVIGKTVTLVGNLAAMMFGPQT